MLQEAGYLVVMPRFAQFNLIKAIKWTSFINGYTSGWKASIYLMSARDKTMKKKPSLILEFLVMMKKL